MAPPWRWMTLDVDTFDARASEDIVDRVLRVGVALTTIAQLGDRDSNHRRLYELNRACSADIPERGAFFTYGEYRAARIDHDGYDPSLVMVALDGADWVGMSAASNHQSDGYLFNEMTGVVRTHRRRGIAVALKLMVIRRARELGVPAIRTFHHPDNEAAIAVNQRLGYVDVEAPPTTG